MRGCCCSCVDPISASCPHVPMYFTPQQPSSKSTTTPPLNTPHSHSTNHTTAQQLATRYATPPLIKTQQTPATTQQPLPPNTHRHQTPAGRAERAAHKSHLGRRARGRRGRRVCDELPHWLPGGLGACLHHMPVSLFFCLALLSRACVSPPFPRARLISQSQLPADVPGSLRPRFGFGPGNASFPGAALRRVGVAPHFVNARFGQWGAPFC